MKIWSPVWAAIALFASTLSGLSDVNAQSGLVMDEADLGEFEDEDFDQFFGLIENDKISADKLDKRCAGKVMGFTYVGKNLTHEGGLQRIDYNFTKLNGSIDGRPLRTKFHNVGFGEWTGSVFKPICPGLHAITIDYTAADGEGLGDNVSVHIFLRREGEGRPGHKMTTALSGGGNGHTTVILALHTGDEVSTYSEAASGGKRVFNTISFSAHKIAHISELTKEMDMTAWGEDIDALDTVAGPLD